MRMVNKAPKASRALLGLMAPKARQEQTGRMAPASKYSWSKTPTGRRRPDSNPLHIYVRWRMQVDLTVGHEIRLAGRSVLEMRCAGRTIWWAPTVTVFASAEQGGWCDPSDLSTLFQVTALAPYLSPPSGKPVGKMLDKSGRGNHLVRRLATGDRRIRTTALADICCSTGWMMRF